MRHPVQFISAKEQVEHGLVHFVQVFEDDKKVPYLQS